MEVQTYATSSSQFSRLVVRRDHSDYGQVWCYYEYWNSFGNKWNIAPIIEVIQTIIEPIRIEERYSKFEERLATIETKCTWISLDMPNGETITRCGKIIHETWPDVEKIWCFN
ncbi:hypothetical protein Glove_156g15 [Diversispora epigaea]|uniref:Uncharacterized protein n=1 Tax=Diversispora epigaea TaxID=1348612 RepID=A0A397IS68_9GLOM|nr:hypothetical protein Glove_156g15 [Diversispora epigaea]